MPYSVVIPAFNAASTIGEAIASIIGQSRPPVDIIVVDDGSTDQTAMVAAACHPSVRVVRQANAGPGAAMTHGLSLSTHPVMASLDADDVWLPRKMERQLGYLDEQPDVDFVFGHLRLFPPLEDHPAGEPLPGWGRSTMVCRLSAALRIGSIDDPPGMRGEMVDWLARGRHLGMKMSMLDDVVALRRIRPGSLSFGRDQARDRGYVHVAWEAIKRRRDAKQG